MKRTPKQKATDIAYICDLVLKEQRNKRKELSKFDDQIEDIKTLKSEYEEKKNQEIESLKSKKCKELKIKIEHINKLTNKTN